MALVAGDAGCGDLTESRVSQCNFMEIPRILGSTNALEAF